MERKEEQAIITYRHLTFEDRKRFETMYASGVTLADAASALGVHLSTIYRELIRGSTGEMDANGRIGYAAEIAQKASLERLKRKSETGTETDTVKNSTEEEEC